MSDRGPPLIQTLTLRWRRVRTPASGSCVRICPAGTFGSIRVPSSTFSVSPASASSALASLTVRPASDGTSTSRVFSASRIDAAANSRYVSEQRAAQEEQLARAPDARRKSHESKSLAQIGALSPTPPRRTLRGRRARGACAGARSHRQGTDSIRQTGAPARGSPGAPRRKRADHLLVLVRLARTGRVDQPSSRPDAGARACPAGGPAAPRVRRDPPRGAAT